VSIEQFEGESDTVWSLLAWCLAERNGLLEENELALDVDWELCMDRSAVLAEHGLKADPDAMVPMFAGLVSEADPDKTWDECLQRAQQIWEGLGETLEEEFGS
jgi:hypothetical protein